MLGKYEIKNLILSSFENFVAQPMSILKGKIINIANLKTNLTDNKSINIDIDKDLIQINVYNNEKVYTLLSCAMHKRRMKELEEIKLNAKNQKSEIFN